MHLERKPVNRRFALARIPINQARARSSFDESSFQCGRMQQLRLAGQYRQGGLDRVAAPIGNTRWQQDIGRKLCAQDFPVWYVLVYGFRNGTHADLVAAV